MNVVKYYYTKPLSFGVCTINPYNDTPVIARVKNGKRYTMAVVYDDAKSEIRFGLATCAPQDNFCKATGQAIATKNADEKPFFIIKGFTGRRNDFADDVMRILINKEERLVKKNYPFMFNSDNFIK